MRPSEGKKLRGPRGDHSVSDLIISSRNSGWTGESDGLPLIISDPLLVLETPILSSAEVQEVLA